MGHIMRLTLEQARLVCGGLPHDSEARTRGPEAHCSRYHPCVSILSKTWSNSQAFIADEYVLQSTARSAVLETDQDVAPEPLLPNYGVGNVRPYNQDLHMLNNYNAAKERTLDEFIDLG